MKSFVRLFVFLSVYCFTASVLAQNSIVNPCYPTVYSVDDFAFFTQKGKKPQPEVKPEYETGREGLMLFFKENPLVVPSETEEYWEVSLVFLVNCKAETGNFEVLSRHSEGQKAVLDNLISLCEQIPPKWLPGKVKGRFMDCYQILKITLKGNVVLKVTLK